MLTHVVGDLRADTKHVEGNCMGSFTEGSASHTAHASDHSLCLRFRCQGVSGIMTDNDLSSCYQSASVHCHDCLLCNSFASVSIVLYWGTWHATARPAQPIAARKELDVARPLTKCEEHCICTQRQLSAP